MILLPTSNAEESLVNNPFFVKKEKMAGVTRLELATSGVTGQRSNQLSYTPDWEGGKLGQAATSVNGQKK